MFDLFKLARVSYKEALPVGHLLKKPEEPPSKRLDIWEWAVQFHKAKRAGPHFDVRLGDPETGKGYSWAGRYLPAPKEKRLFNIQPVHELEYFNFEGKIPDGYGAGLVRLVDRGKALIIRSSPAQVKFVVPDRYRPREFMLVKRQGKQWFLINTTEEKLPISRELLERGKFNDITETELPKFLRDRDYIMQRKDDGIHAVWVLRNKKQIRAFSAPRTADQEVIEHTHKFPDIIDTKARHEAVIKGEVFAVDARTGKALPLNITTSILMSDPVEALRKQQAYGAKLKRTAFDIVYYDGKYVGNLPYAERLKLLQQVAPEYGFEIPATAFSPSEKEKLLKDIASGKVKETKEGVVFRHKYLNSPPLRFKFRPEFDVYVVGIKEGSGSLAGRAAGGIIYSYSKNGPPAGVVGSGFTLEERMDMWRNPKKYIGRVAKVYAKEKLPSGALRQPSFIAWHPEYLK